MYRHILIPTDGSDLSRSATDAALALAGRLGSRATAVHVIPARAISSLEAWAHGSKLWSARLTAMHKEHARRFLRDIAVRAQAAGVRCRCEQIAGEQVYEEIIKLARVRRCDLIYMASHGRNRSDDVLLGSETVKVLAHSPVPVLVHRGPGGQRAMKRRPQARSPRVRSAKRTA